MYVYVENVWLHLSPYMTGLAKVISYSELEMCRYTQIFRDREEHKAKFDNKDLI